MEWIRKTIGFMLLMLVIGSGMSQTVHEYVQLPDRLFIYEQEVMEAEGNVYKAANQKLNHEKFSVDKLKAEEELLNEKAQPVAIQKNGKTIKQADLEVIPNLYVVPGGQSIGVKLNSKGVMVVGYHQVHSENGNQSPAKEAGIEVGDRIIKINDQNIKKMGDVSRAVQEASIDNKPLKMTIERGKNTYEKSVVPVKDKREDDTQLGLYIRDSAAGVGTLTFYEPKSGKYGALGHVISDTDTKKPIVVKDGEIVKSSVTSIQKGSNGQPGEKQAQISTSDRSLGKITKNSAFGIFGELYKKHGLKNNLIDKPLPVAMPSEVEEGPAEILTVVEGEKVQKYDIEIVKKSPQSHPATKGLVIKVTDEKLLNETGGIIQGMSGSPIIQNGKMVGAVTHVFVNDSTSGYGSYIEWMLEEAGIDVYKNSEAKAS